MPTKIEWTEEVWNPITGCTKISEGCQNCYAERFSRRLAGQFGYPRMSQDPFKVTFHADRLEKPLHWKKPRRVFVSSMGDLFHPEVLDSWLFSIFSIMLQARQHTFLILTKRPARMKEYVRDMWGAEFGNAVPQNIWLGVSVENEENADRILWLLETPAALRFVSCEPLLRPINLRPYLRGTAEVAGKIDWIIAGAETGPRAREASTWWFRHLQEQCTDAGVPFFFKRASDGSRLLDGRMWEEYPKGEQRWTRQDGTDAIYVESLSPLRTLRQV